ncbi:hypothetical protein [Mesorhizobium sp.]|uniref:hypothetical protein n=1 Tax=Mesorhizobium sp. TaxID=1871066 RepID=UPI0025C6325F|nr:hypothetical protein [Mesorhizobium sp.]
MTAIALMPFNPASKTKRLIHKLSRIQQTVPRGAWRVSAPWVGMFLHLDTTWLLFAFLIIAGFGFFFGTALDAIMKESGFGPTGNTLLFIFGFFAAMVIAHKHGISLSDLRLAVACGLGGAFAFISVLALIKAGMARL